MEERGQAEGRKKERKGRRKGGNWVVGKRKRKGTFDRGEQALES